MKTYILKDDFVIYDGLRRKHLTIKKGTEWIIYYRSTFGIILRNSQFADFQVSENTLEKYFEPKNKNNKQIISGDRTTMKILKHGRSIIFKCKDCGCEFSELPNKCYSSTGSDGAHYCMSCPECLCTCWATEGDAITNE